MDTRAPGNPLAHTFDRNGADIGDFTPIGATIPYKYAFDTIGKQSRAVQLGRCYTFDLVDDTVTFPNSSLFFNNNVELEFWWVPTSVANKAGILLVGYNGVSGSAGGWSVDLNTSQLRFAYYTSNTTNQDLFFVTPVLVINTTYQVKIRLIPNGTLTNWTVTITPYGGTPVVTTFTAGTSNLIWPSTGTTKFSYMSGKVWGIKMTNMATSGLILMAKCDEQAGIIAYDSSGNGLDGAIGNASQATFHSSQTVYSYQNEVGYNNAGQLYFEDFNYAATSAVSSGSVGGWTFNTVESGVTFNLNGTGGLLISKPGAQGGQTAQFIKSFVISKTGWYRMRIVKTLTGSGSIYWRWEAFAGSTQVLAGSGTTDVAWHFTPGTYFFTIYPQGSAFTLVIDSFELTQLTFYPRNEASPLVDVIGNSLSYTGRVKYSAWLKQSYCATFSGTQYILMGNKAAFVPAGGFVVSMFVRRTANGRMTLFHLQGNASGATNGPRLSIDAGNVGVYSFSWRVSSGTTIDTLFQTVLNQWYYVVCVCTGSSAGASYSLYVDGNLIGTLTGGYAMGTTTDAVNTVIGGIYVGSASGAFTGQLANFQYANYSAGNLTKALARDTMDSMIFQLPMAEGNGIISFDASGNANNGGITGATLSTYWGTKQDYYHYNLLNSFKTMVHFPTASYYTIPATALTSLTTQLTIAGWFLPGTITTNRRIFSKDDNSTNRCIMLQVGISNRISFSIWNDSGTLKQAITALGYTNTVTPIHFACVFDGSLMAIYIDGVLDASSQTAQSGSVKPGAITATVGSGSNEHLTGSLRDFQMWGQAWTQSDITYHKTSGDIPSNRAGTSLLVANCLLRLEMPGANFNTLANDTSLYANAITTTGTPALLRIPAIAETVLPETIKPQGRALNPAETQCDFTTGVASPMAAISGASSSYQFQQHSKILPATGLVRYSSQSKENNFLIYATLLGYADAQRTASFLKNTSVLEVMDCQGIYALTRVSATYTGPILKLQRVSDSAIRVVYFKTDGTIDWTDLATWKGASSLQVLIWYDQSRYARHLANGTNKPTLNTSTHKVALGLTGDYTTAQTMAVSYGTISNKFSLFYKYTRTGSSVNGDFSMWTFGLYDQACQAASFYRFRYNQGLLGTLNTTATPSSGKITAVSDVASTMYEGNTVVVPGSQTAAFIAATSAKNLTIGGGAYPYETELFVVFGESLTTQKIAALNLLF